METPEPILDYKTLSIWQEISNWVKKNKEASIFLAGMGVFIFGVLVALATFAGQCITQCLWAMCKNSREENEIVNCETIAEIGNALISAKDKEEENPDNNEIEMRELENPDNNEIEVRELIVDEN